MTKMTEAERAAFLRAEMKDAVKYNGDFMKINEDLLSEYLGMPYGDEVDGQSQFVSTDIADVVEADMPSLARIFLGSNDILEFIPNTDDPQEIKEADEKTKYINYLVRHRADSFKTIHDWIKDAEIQKFGAVKFYVEEKKSIDHKSYQGLSVDEIAMLKESLKAKGNVESVTIVSQDKEGDYYNIKLKIIQKQQKICIKCVPTENFLITRNAPSIAQATLVGDLSITTRKALVAEGYDKEKVAKLPAKNDDPDSARMREIRFEGQGGYDSLTNDQQNETVQIANVYPLVDFDGDGILERRNVVMSACGTIILEDEPYGIVPYALLSAVLMPHSAIGRSRAEITAPTQYLKTHLVRGINNNIYQVNKPGTAINDSTRGGVNLDDLLTQRFDRVVRCEGNPYEMIMPLVTPYIGDKALQVLQYVDAARAQTTGSLMASQGLSADDLHKETATRFNGVEDQSEAKVELVARVYTETGFRELFEGLAWLVAHFQDEAAEIRVLGKPLTIDPTQWQYEHNCVSNVGIGAGDNSEIMNNMTGLLQIQQNLQGSPLVDSKKTYNVLSKLVKSMGQARVNDFFNDPTQPDQILLAENEQLKAAVAQLQSQLQNPLAEAEKIKAQAKLIVAEAEHGAKMQAEADKSQTEMGKFLLQQAAEQEQFRREMALKLTELELKYQQGSQSQTEDIPGSLV